MPNYDAGKIYRIVVGDSFYIGSTTLSLNQRWCNHKQDIGRRSRLYQAMRENDVGTIQLVENFPCRSRAELTARENLWIMQSLGDSICLNMRRGHLTAEESRAYHKQYREKKILCECGMHITAGNIATHRKSKRHAERLENVVDGAASDHHDAVVGVHDVESV